MRHFNKPNKQRTSFLLQLNSFLFFAFLVGGVFANELSYCQTIENQDWKVLKEADGVKVFYLIDNCSSKALLHLKVVNKGEAAKKIILIATIKRNEENISSLPTTPPKLLKAGEEILSNCNNPSELLSLTIYEEFDISSLQVNLIVLP